MQQNVPETPQSLRQHKIHFYRQIAFTFIGAAVVILAGLIYFSLSQALIIVTPSLQDVSADFNVLVKSDTEKTEEGIVAQLIHTTVELEKTADAELLEEGEPQQATGIVTLINTSSQAQPLVATTRLLSEEGVLFRLRKGVTVPANGEIEAEVYADKEGKEGEIGPSRFTIPGLNEARQQEVYARSEAAMTGGTKATYQVTEDAIKEAIEAAEAQLVMAAQEQLGTEGVNADELLPNASFVEVTSREVDPEEGANAQKFTVTLTAEVAFIMADEDDLLQLAQAQLYSNTSLGYELSSSDEGSFQYEVVNFDPDNGTAQIRVTLAGDRRISSNHPSLDTSNFVGQKPEEVKQTLESDPGIQSVDVQLRPFWLRRVPRLVDHIYVQFAN